MQLSQDERKEIIERELTRLAADNETRSRPRARFIAWACLGFAVVVIAVVALLLRTETLHWGHATPWATATPYPTYTRVPTFTSSATARPADTPWPSATTRLTNTPLPTYTLYPTNMPLPTYTLYPTSTPQATLTEMPTRTPVPPSPVPRPLGVLRVDHWLFEITAVRSDPGMDTSRQLVVLLANITNQGQSTDTFSDYSLMLRDSHGREYEHDRVAGWAAMDKYGTDYGASMSPGTTEYIAVAFNLPSSEKAFTIIPGSLVVSWSGDIAFTLP